MTPSNSRVLFIHSSDELYGADRMLLEFLDALPSGVEALVWLPTDIAHPDRPLCAELGRRDVAFEHVDLPILRRAYRTPPALLRLLARTVRLRRHLAATRPDLVYCTTSATFLCAPVARSMRHTRVYGHLQEIWTRSDRAVLGVLARACHRLLAISAAVADAAGETLRRRVTVVPNGTPDPGPYRPLDERSGPLRFVIASRWNGWKGHRTLLQAWEEAGLDASLTVLGGPPPSGDAVDVRALVDGMSRPASVDVVGEVDDFGAYLEGADVVLVPSDQPEPFGLVAIEAFARGRPVIASAAGGLLDIVTDGADGWLFPPGDAAALVAVLRRLDRAEVTRAGQAARGRYLASFSREQFARHWRQAALPSLAER